MTFTCAWKRSRWQCAIRRQFVRRTRACARRKIVEVLREREVVETRARLLFDARRETSARH